MRTGLQASHRKLANSFVPRYPRGQYPKRRRIVAAKKCVFRLAIWGFVLLLVGGVCACSAVYPELSSPTRPAPAGAKLEPEPPDDVVYIEIKEALIPKRTRDGREWDAVGGNLPDPFVILFSGKDEILRTSVQSNTLTPTWPDSVKANYRIQPGTQMRLEIWDSNALTHKPICVTYIDDIHQSAGHGELDVMCNSGAKALLVVDRARPMLGLGLYYELRAESVFVTRVLEESPASRAGLKQGIEIVSVQGEPVAGMDSAEVRSLINVHSRTGLELVIRQPGGATETLTLKEGPVYPLVTEGVKLQ